MTSYSVHTESAFEEAIVTYLTNNGWRQGAANAFSRDLALDKNAVLDFVRASQPTQWAKLETYYKADTANKFIQRLFKELDMRGTLDVLRHGFTDSGIPFRLAYFRPNHARNPDTIEQYGHNRLVVTRQVFFSSTSRHSLDLLLSLNGLPVATIELKNHLTGSTVADAEVQYVSTRDPRELLFQFKKRAIVHFTLDPDSVSLTTRLDGSSTRFIPFNRGNRGGAGNVPNGYGYRTAYFWEEILEPHSWLEIIGRFMHLQKDRVKDKLTGNQYVRETMLFPRYHQLDAVRRLAADVWANGAGQTYLIQHSAGSGKSNTAITKRYFGRSSSLPTAPYWISSYRTPSTSSSINRA
jgi:type I restriction enzyme, R subunit